MYAGIPMKPEGMPEHLHKFELMKQCDFPAGSAVSRADENKLS
jgi:hypothetical protein